MRTTKRKTRVLLALKLISCFTLFISCADDPSPSPSPVCPQTLTIDGACRSYKLNPNHIGKWSVISSPAWALPVNRTGLSNDKIEIYVENNSRQTRNGIIEIKYDDGTVQNVPIRQSTDEGIPSIQRRFAVGWGVDVRTYNDQRGMRNQIFNYLKIKMYEKNQDRSIYQNQVNTNTRLEIAEGNDVSSVGKEMAIEAGIDGKFNAFQLELRGAYGTKASMQEKRYFIHMRQHYLQRDISLNNIDLNDVQNVHLDGFTPSLFTVDFAFERQKVINANASDESISELFDMYGTHIIMKAELGGCYDYYYSVKTTDDMDETKANGIIKGNFAQKFKLNGSGTYNNELDNAKYEKIEKFQVKGGNSLELATAIAGGHAEEALFTKWKGLLQDINNCDLLSYQAIPIYSLFPSNIANKILAYSNRLYYSEFPLTRKK